MRTHAGAFVTLSRCGAAAVALLILAAGLLAINVPSARADGPGLWNGMRRGAWLRLPDAPAIPGEVTLVGAAGSTEPPLVLVVAGNEDSCVHYAAECLAGDIEKITDVRPEIVSRAPGGNRPFVQIETTPESRSEGRWEAYDIMVGEGGVRIHGSDPRGTAFGVYELCERIGVDPLYLWTGYTPLKARPLRLRPIRYTQDPPAVRYRGLFHDDEDILPRPRTANGAPDHNGTVPLEWYSRYFETALRLRMNMVAPWVRTNRYFDVQKLASERGLYYTSHHYDTLLSDPYHFTRGSMLAKQRGVKPEWDWVTNRDGLIRYWQGGLDENKNLHAIYPIGMRGTEDYSYRFPKEWTADQKIAAYNEALRTQADMVHHSLPKDREPLMHFTMYTEMLPFYQTGKLKVPSEAIVVWPDNNDGVMRGLPTKEELSANRHGVYYHLAYLGSPTITKQTHQTVSLDRIGKEFRGIFAAGASEFCLVNVSELREYVLGTRYIADICWNGAPAIQEDDSPDRFLSWWCREYFGDAAAPAAASAYKGYFALLPMPDVLGFGAGKCLGAETSLQKKLKGETFAPARSDTLLQLEARRKSQADLKARIDEAAKQIPFPEAQRFFFENLGLAADIDRLPTEAAIDLVNAMSEPDRDRSYSLCLQALVPLDTLETELRRAERWPFEGWYGPSWIGARNQMLIDPRLGLIRLLQDNKPPVLEKK